MNGSASGAGRRGFTLLEILVALVLIGLLAGALVPSVVSQLGRGEANRVVEDAGTVAAAVKSFRVDVGRFPGELDHLVLDLAPTDEDINENVYPAGLRARWSGPYLDQGGLRPDNTLPTGMGGSIVNAFAKTAWGGKDYLTVKIAGITQSDAEAVSTALDGDDDVTLATETAGRVRWKTGGASDPDTLVYLAAPVN